MTQGCWPMTARTLAARSLCALLGLAPWLAGCGLSSRHEARRIPQLGVIDPHQPKELEMVSMPPYVVEPPDELEILARPTPAAMANQTTFIVRSDGNIDLGFGGDVYVAGLTLAQVEQKVAQHLEATEADHGGRREPIEVSVRLVNGSQSKFYYVLGTVSNQGKFPITGNETVLDGIIAAGLRSNSLPEKAY